MEEKEKTEAAKPEAPKVEAPKKEDPKKAATADEASKLLPPTQGGKKEYTLPNGTKVTHS